MANEFVVENGVLKEYKGRKAKIVIPDGVKRIGGFAFCECQKLKSITIPESVTEIGCDAFSNTKWLEKQRKINPLVIVNNILIDGKSAKGDVIISEGVTEICGWAFSLCENLTSIVIPDSVAKIGDSAFGGCTSLASVMIPEGVTKIGEQALLKLCQ